MRTLWLGVEIVSADFSWQTVHFELKVDENFFLFKNGYEDFSFGK